MACDQYKAGQTNMTALTSLVEERLIERLKTDMTKLGAWNADRERDAKYHLPINAAGIAFAGTLKAKGKLD